MMVAERPRKVLRAADTGDGGHLMMFYCPGCHFHHGPAVGGRRGPQWEWNGDEYKPTFKPSILVQWHTLSPEARARNNDFYRHHGRYMTDAESPPDVHHVCHSFVTDGMIQFLNDCTHDLAGQTVPLPTRDDPEAW